MSIFLKGGRAAKALSKFKRKSVAPVALIGGGSVIGAALSADAAEPGLKRSAAKEGAIEGAAIGTALFFTPKAARAGARKLAKDARKTARKGKLVFRRIRGRIIPIRPKAETVGK